MFRLLIQPLAVIVIWWRSSGHFTYYFFRGHLLKIYFIVFIGTPQSHIASLIIPHPAKLLLKFPISVLNLLKWPDLSLAAQWAENWMALVPLVFPFTFHTWSWRQIQEGFRDLGGTLVNVVYIRGLSLSEQHILFWWSDRRGATLLTIGNRGRGVDLKHSWI